MSSGVRAVTPPNLCAGVALDSARPDLLASAHWDHPGTVLKPGSRSTVTLVKIGDISYVFKQYKALAFHRRLRYALSQSRARQSWENGQAMAEFGLPVVRPLAFFEERTFGIPKRALLIMPFQEGTALDQFDDLSAVRDALKVIFDKMAKHQVTHGDLKASNILIDHKNDPHFIDIDASVIHRRSASYQKLRRKDEARFLRNWDDRPEARKLFEEIFD